MSHDYRVVQWTPFKKTFDLWLGSGIIVFLAAHVASAVFAFPPDQHASEVQLALRASGSCAFALLSLILAIGPAARLSPRFLPLLYNRRHMGVVCFLIALLHGGLVVFWYHGFSGMNPLVSVLVSNSEFHSARGFPFETLGVGALLILFVMAATSHDFWNANLGPGLWKAIHMSVYGAYVLIVGHVMLGAAQGDEGFAWALAVGISAALVMGLHLGAGVLEARRGALMRRIVAEGWLRVGAALDIPDTRARVVSPPKGERIAVFRDGDRIHAISNVCRHQGGPLGEGRIVDGSITCPWHGFQYRPEDGCSPPPYSERVATYRTRIQNGIVFVHPEALPLGTGPGPTLIGGASPAPSDCSGEVRDV